jgi:Zn-finger nucleic acid-binding protein
MDTATMKCPKCNAGMETVRFEGIEVERCAVCHGLWFELLEHEDLKALKGSEAIDDGLRSVGRNFDAVPALRCPACGAGMVRMVDARHPHLWYESCSSCYGVFFDAGEFRDFKHDTLLDRIKDLLRPERR